MVRTSAILSLCLFCLWCVLPAESYGVSAVEDEERLRAVIEAVEERTGYQFLYRDALISGKRVQFSLEESGDVFDRLAHRLRVEGVGMRVDHERQQVLLHPHNTDRPRARVSGYVVDADRGARLPFATIVWEEEGRTRGVVANESGAFQARVPEGVALTASYVGYEARTVEAATSGREIAIRLAPANEHGPEVVVNSSVLDTDVDTTWHNLIQPELAAPFGEQSVLRALQPLPSVSLSGAFSDGLSVRGSRADGFQVLLDGVPIYNQSHFFGLFDAFNEDALQTVAFYYGVAPASFAAPPGGTLSFVTRTGSQTGHRQRVSLSNTAIRGTAEGPLADGRGSWLIAGRHSFLDTFSLFQNDRLVNHGLNIERPTEVFSTGGGTDADPGVTQADPTARFYDLHGKLQMEWDSGHRIMASGYIGGDRTAQDGQRQPSFFIPDNGEGEGDIDLLKTSTRNEWGNEAGSVRWFKPVASNIFGRTTVAASRYYSMFDKENFVYTRLVQPDGTPGSMQARNFLSPLRSENSLLNLKAEQQFEGALGSVSSWSAGTTVQQFDVTYSEESAARPNYTDESRSTKVDLFGQLDWKDLSWLNMQAGLRTHYATQGSFWRFSPRIQTRLFPEQALSIGLGYSKNHQFLHRLSLERNATGNIWVMSDESQPPTRVHNATAGAYLKISSNTLLQVEAYAKSYDNVRQHEALLPTSQFLDSVLLSPWRYSNTASARGLEFMKRQQFGPVNWTSSYALARVDLQNDDVNGGEPFAASWDRRHEFTTHLKTSISDGLTAHLTWMWASGAPNTLALTHDGEPERLSPYHRMDASLHYRERVFGALLEARLGLFNLYNRNNPWYRTRSPHFERDGSTPLVGFDTIEVSDLGFQPSVEFTISF